MKIVFDLDGTLTDFNKFVFENAVPYFECKYKMQVVNSSALEIEDIFEMYTFFQKTLGCSEDEAKKEVQQALDKYWIRFQYIKYVFSRFRYGARKILMQLKKQGFEVEIHTSRSKTCDDNIIGKIARLFTVLQFKFNGIALPKSAFYFYKNDKDKMNSILSRKPLFVFEDKVENINQLVQNGIKTICVRGVHNTQIVSGQNVEVIDGFGNDTIEKMAKLFGEKEYEYCKRIVNSDLFFDEVKKIRPLVMFFLNH